MADLVVIGSSNTDMVIWTSKFPRPGETLMGGEFFMFSGGKGANQAVAAARIGGVVSFIGKTGNDIFGQRMKEELMKERIDISNLFVDPDKPSGTALILVDEKGENEIVVAPGANETLSAGDIDKAAGVIAKAGILLLQLEIPVNSVLHAAKLGHQSGKKVILNPAPARSIPDDLYKNLYLITPNESEAFQLTGIEVNDMGSASMAAESLLKRGVQHVIITMGASGAYYHGTAGQLFISAPTVKAVDTTAAGDTFNGVLAVQICQEKNWESAISFACKVASISVTRMGAQASMPFLEELET